MDQRTPERVNSDVAARVTDPVCGMQVVPDTHAPHADFAEHSFFFCSSGCRSKFVAKSWPVSQSRGQSGRAGRHLHLPDAPEVRGTMPGSCPKCGMALEP